MTAGPAGGPCGRQWVRPAAGSVAAAVRSTRDAQVSEQEVGGRLAVA